MRGWARPSRERWLRPPHPASSSTLRPVPPRPGPPRPVSRLGIVHRGVSGRATGWLWLWLGLALGSGLITRPPIRWEVGMAGQGRGSRVLSARQSLGYMWILALILAGTVAVVFPLGGRDLWESKGRWTLRRHFRSSWTLTSARATRMFYSASRRRFARPLLPSRVRTSQPRRSESARLFGRETRPGPGLSASLFLWRLCSRTCVNSKSRFQPLASGFRQRSWSLDRRGRTTSEHSGRSGPVRTRSTMTPLLSLRHPVPDRVASEAA